MDPDSLRLSDIDACLNPDLDYGFILRGWSAINADLFIPLSDVND